MPTLQTFNKSLSKQVERMINGDLAEQLAEQVDDLRAKLNAYEILFSCVSIEFYEYYEKLEKDIEAETNKNIKKILVDRKKQLDKYIDILEL